jgi:hypothetical protein
MGSQIIIRTNFVKILNEVNVHLSRLEQSFAELSKTFDLPLTKASFAEIIQNPVHLAFCDQIIYRFSKAQDTIGGKLFKAYLLVQGENIDKPFLDILNGLEKNNILSVEQWFELREIRNEIAHDYENDENHGKDVINLIYGHKNELIKIVEAIRC